MANWYAMTLVLTLPYSELVVNSSNSPCHLFPWVGCAPWEKKILSYRSCARAREDSFVSYQSPNRLQPQGHGLKKMLTFPHEVECSA